MSCKTPEFVPFWVNYSNVINPVRMANLTNSVRECILSLAMMRSR